MRQRSCRSCSTAPAKSLNCGREQRVANRAQRRALRAMYRTCGYPGCDVSVRPLRHPPRHRLAPPRQHRSRQSAAVVQSQHHHLVHEGRWRLTLDKHRVITIHRPDGTRHFHGTTTNRTGRGRDARGSQPPVTGDRATGHGSPEATNGRPHVRQGRHERTRAASLDGRDRSPGGGWRAADDRPGAVSSLSSHVRHRRRCEPSPNAPGPDRGRDHRWARRRARRRGPTWRRCAAAVAATDAAAARAPRRARARRPPRSSSRSIESRLDEARGVRRRDRRTQIESGSRRRRRGEGARAQR